MESGSFAPEQDHVGTSAEKNELFCQRAIMLSDNSDVTRRRR